MASRSGMRCYFCNKKLEDAQYIAVDKNDEIMCLCQECYDVVKQFFNKKGSKNGA